MAEYFTYGPHLMVKAMRKAGINFPATKAECIKKAGDAMVQVDFDTYRPLADVIAELDPDHFGICLDTGHALLVGHEMRTLINKLGHRIECLHIHDNDGRDDLHVPPYMGILDWDRFIAGMRDIGYKGVFTFECDSSVRPADYWQGNRRRWREEHIAEPPLAT